MERTIRLGTRGSQLAVRQSGDVAAALEKAHPGLRVELEIIRTSGDRFADAPLAELGGKGLFVKEIEEGLLARRIHVAVHSMKDVPAELAAGLCIGAVSQRDDPRDALLLPAQPGDASEDGPDGVAGTGESGLDRLPPGANVGTSSLRRKAQLLHSRPDLHIVPLRGNLDTRIRKLRQGEVDAIVLAAAGLHRMGWRETITAYLEPSLCLPAIGQGALAIEIRQDDADLQDIVTVLNDAATACAVRAERAVLRTLSGSCQVPIAGYAEVGAAGLSLRGLLAALDGGSIIVAERSGALDEADDLGASLGEEILARGGRELLADILAAEAGEQR